MVLKLTRVSSALSLLKTHLRSSSCGTYNEGKYK